MDIQRIPQNDADELVRILITVNPDLGAGQIMKLAVREGMPLSQAIDTAGKYLGWDRRIAPQRCVEHNTRLPCSRKSHS
jgi:hypothetical protein